MVGSVLWDNKYGIAQSEIRNVFGNNSIACPFNLKTSTISHRLVQVALA
jgi:hypothetical protein